jgi:pimeloyl-ACP methyl ester carboxylesterase/DNA-binding CsgD family transcriptional regulator
VEQRIASARLSDGTNVAYALSGQGPFLVYAPGWLTHLELSWALPSERAFCEALSKGRTLLRYDRPGCGLSDRDVRAPSIERELATLAAVTRAAGADRFDLLGTSLGAPVAATWSAAHPESVGRLILYGGWVRGSELTGPGLREHVLGLVVQHWGLGSDVLADIFAPFAGQGTRAAYARYQRESASPQTASAMLALCYEIDVSAALPKVKAPTLVLHRDRDRAAPLEQGRALANGISGARLDVLPGRSHLPHIGDADALARSIRRFLGLSALRRRASPVLTSRQREVAAPVAGGLTNRQIAERLVITERSAESHVERIRDRLGFRSRAQIAAWFVATGS